MIKYKYGQDISGNCIIHQGRHLKCKKITTDDISKVLNISKSLVSRALTDGYGVNDDTRTKNKNF